ncbi:MAG TPA: cytochrome c [Candidatus Angelobacter sp.]|nr:cytochrome c [Candidatus Angelobacter sp.]
MRRTASILLMMIAAGLLSGCGKDPAQMSDAELGLNAQQSRGRKVFNIYCMNCHPAYSSKGNKGPGLKKVLQKQYLPSGMTATDEHTMQSITRGRGMMPRFGDQLDDEELQELMAYLHTL